VAATTTFSIAHVTASAVTDTSADISWTTSRPATGRVEYGAAPSYGRTTALDPALTTLHTFTLASLAASTAYSYRVLSVAGTAALISSGGVFTTRAKPAETTVTLTASATSTASGTPITLSWTSTKATSCTGTNFTPTGTAGSLAVSPTDTTIYTITCEGHNGSASDSVGVAVFHAPTVSLVALPASVVQGQSSTLAWSSADATSCTGTGFSTSQATAGSVGVAPAQTTTYTVSCAGAGGTVTASAIVSVRSAGPLRLAIDGKTIRDPYGNPITLRGANVELLDAAVIDEIANPQKLNMNFIRYRVNFLDRTLKDLSPDTPPETVFTPNYRDRIKSDIDLILANNSTSNNKLWILFEMRVPAFSTSSALYLPGGDLYQGYLKAWKYIAETYKDTDYIAGYGLMSEPSAEEAGIANPRAALIAMQRNLMDEITTIDPVTPFFIGPNFNYRSFQYRFDDYYTAFADRYQGRLVYEVNYLVPRPWIETCELTSRPYDPLAFPPLYPSGSQPVSTNPDNPFFTPLITPAPGETFLPDETLERAYLLRVREPEKSIKMLDRAAFAWYLAYPLQFSDAHNVPLYVDQFGASSNCASRGQVAFERDFVDFMESQHLNWSRWSYNAGGEDRTLLDLPMNASIRALYESLAGTYSS
jgi:hypothetical protein